MTLSAFSRTLAPMDNHDSPTLTLDPAERPTLCASGPWRVQDLAQNQVLQRLQKTLTTAPSDENSLSWDLRQITALDHIGAQWLWNAWGHQRPEQLLLSDHHADIFQRLEDIGPLALPPPSAHHWLSAARLQSILKTGWDHVSGFVALIGQLVLDIGRLLAQPQRGPWKEISASVFRTGYQALGITALVGFLIGVVLSYLSSQQLQMFGADIFLVNILGMSIIRELGPLLAAILVAGRSGSAITAQLGVMRVTEELDAMLVMGLPHGFRLIMPRVLALSLAMPLLVVWTDAMALLGGMAAAQLEMGLSPAYFLQQLPEAVPLANYWIGLGKGVVFGALIALVACHFGLRIKANTESLGQGTTTSVVTAITIVILADAVFAILFKGVGF